METRSRFDLTAAFEDWRKQLAAQPGLTADNRRELELHLRDSIAALQQHGLTEEECFWLACRRVGQPQLLGHEFAKVDPAAVWRDRLFWLALGICVLRIWSGFPAYLMDKLRSAIWHTLAANFYLPDWILFYVPIRTQWINEFLLQNQIFVTLFRWGPLICLLGVLAVGRSGRAVSAVRFFFESRVRFLIAAAVSLAIYYGWAIAAAVATLGHAAPAPGIPSLGFAIQLAIGNAIISALFICLVAWLMPVQRAAFKSA